MRTQNWPSEFENPGLRSVRSALWGQTRAERKRPANVSRAKRRAMRSVKHLAGVAQLAEQGSRKAQVASSMLAAGSNPHAEGHTDSSLLAQTAGPRRANLSQAYQHRGGSLG